MKEETSKDVKEVVFCCLLLGMKPTLKSGLFPSKASLEKLNILLQVVIN